MKLQYWSRIVLVVVATVFALTAGEERKKQCAGHGEKNGKSCAAHKRDCAKHCATGKKNGKQCAGHKKNGEQCGAHKNGAQDESAVGLRCAVGGGPADSTVHADHEGKRYYFCCAGCRDAFLKNPAEYTAASVQMQEPEEKAEAKNARVRYEVFGMDCPGCHGGVEKLVKKLPGVLDAKANYKKKEIVVVMKDGSEPNEKSLFKAIRKANFTPGKRLE